MKNLNSFENLIFFYKIEYYLVNTLSYFDENSNRSSFGTSNHFSKFQNVPHLETMRSDLEKPKEGLF